MKKIIIIGCPGSGKSTLARRLKKKTGLPLYHLDLIWHKPDKTNIGKEKFDAKLKKILKRKRWIIDGNYGRTLKLRLEECDTAILLDFPTDVCLKGAEERVGKKHKDLPFVEKEFDPEFKNWIADFNQNELPKIYEKLEQFKDKINIVVLKSRKDVETFLSEPDLTKERQNFTFLNLSEEEKASLDVFYKDFQNHCYLTKKDNKKLWEDFKKAIIYYLNNGFCLSDALNLLDVKFLGGFYARPPMLWFPLDDAAKIYPISMDHGRMNMFRLAVNLKNPVVPELLQMALNFTIKRFPSFATTLKKGTFWHYLDAAKKRFSAEPETDIPCQPMAVSKSGSEAFRVLYYGNRISVEIFHILTDATGGMTFLKTLVSEYIRLTGADVVPDGDLWDINQTPELEEFDNAFSKVEGSENSSGFVDKPALQMSGRLSNNSPCRLLHFKMNVNDLKSGAEKYNVTVTSYMLSLMFLASKSATDELSGEMSFQVPVNMRKFYPLKTVRNFSMYCGVRLPLEEITDMNEITKKVSVQLKEKTSKEVMSEMLTSTKNLVRLLKFVPLGIKQPVAKMVCGFLGDRIFTSTLSNFGIVNLPSTVAEHIENIEFALGGNSINRVSCAMVTFNNTVTFSISKMTADPSFEERLYDLLCLEGVDVSVEGSELYGY